MVPWLLPIWQATLGRPIARAELPDCCTPGAIRQPRRLSDAAPARSKRKTARCRIGDRADLRSVTSSVLGDDRPRPWGWLVGTGLGP